MENQMNGNFIGVFDSGAGGITILKEMKKMLPKESFVYFGDSLYTPYGDRSEDWIRERSLVIASMLVENGAKALVIACNTASAAGAAAVREKYPDIPVVAVEPALKLAVDESKKSHLENPAFLVMATDATLRLEKYHTLEEKLHDDANFIPLPCVGLADRIEKGDFDGEDLKEYLEEKLSEYKGKVDGVILGCTHYPLIKKQIANAVGDVPMYDGANGCARRLKDLLEKNDLCSEGDGEIVYLTSSPEEGVTEKYRSLYEMTGDK